MDKVIIGLGGSSGSIYGKLLLDRLASMPDQYAEVGIVMSKNAAVNWALEMKEFAIESYGFRVYSMMIFLRHLPAVLPGSTR
jgi:4-hydroxy-3-polyprenylbenzoate decarboxylase